jgi:RNase adapter protein RapZ
MALGLDIVIITGMSGSGKSVAIRALEDTHFFCIDNLPAVLIPKFIELCNGYRGEINRVALGVDLRAGQFLHDWPQILSDMRAAGHDVQVLFFDASDQVLLRRFNETRRPHPLADSGFIEEGIARERKALEGMRGLADSVIDTSELNVHELKREIESRFSRRSDIRGMNVFLLSFGYKYGTPHDADIVIDVRFLPNPFFVDTLRHKSGLEPDVAKYVLQRAETQAFFSKLESLLDFTLPLYEKEGKRSVTIALGCTGGRHRSVVLIEELRSRIDGDRFRVNVKHRDVDK